MAEYLSVNGQSPSGLDRKQLDELRVLLVHARAETMARLHAAEETARSAEQLSEPMDVAELAREQGDAALLIARARTRLLEIDDSLARMNAGTYGVSERSGIPIGFERLKALPWTRLAAEEEVEVHQTA